MNTTLLQTVTKKLISTRESFTAQFALVIVFQYFMKLFFLRLECQTPVKG